MLNELKNPQIYDHRMTLSNTTLHIHVQDIYIYIIYIQRENEIETPNCKSVATGLVATRQVLGVINNRVN